MHPHQQIVALPVLPDAVGKRMDLSRHVPRGCTYCRWIKRELSDGSRILDQVEDVAAMAAFAPRFPFEWLLLPTMHDRFDELEAKQITGLAKLLSRGLRAMALACGNPDFNLVLFSGPPGHGMDAGWGLDVLPRMSTQAGFEWGTGVHIVSTPPEEAAIRLKGFWQK